MTWACDENTWFSASHDMEQSTQKTAWSLQRSEMSSSLEISNIWLRLFTQLHTSEPRVLGIFILILVYALGTRSVQSFVKHIVLQRIMLSDLDAGLSIQMIDKVPEWPFLFWDGLPPQTLMEIGQVATVAEEAAEVGGQVEEVGGQVADLVDKRKKLVDK